MKRPMTKPKTNQHLKNAINAKNKPKLTLWRLIQLILTLAFIAIELTALIIHLKTPDT